MSLLVPACALSSGQGGGFQRAELPYTYPSQVTSQPTHAINIAILPIRDARSVKDGTDSAYRYSYRGKSYGFTDLRGLRRSAERYITTILARHLLAKSVFSKIVLIDRMSDAGSVDLVLTAKLARARGYAQRKEKSTDTSSSASTQRSVMSEFIISELTLAKRSDVSAVVFDGDFGWSIFEEREFQSEEEAAWQVLSEAMRRTLDQMTKALKKADLSGGFLVNKQVKYEEDNQSDQEFGLLATKAPLNWKVVSLIETSTAPNGWKAKNAACKRLSMRAQQSWRFHRVLGPYQPELVLWSCASTTRFLYDVKTEHPAEFLGTGQKGRLFFLRSLGETNWRTARDDVRRHLKLVPPKQRYLFQLGGTSN